MLFSGIVFVRSFAAADRKDPALGANLFGSLVGGLLQSVTFVTGMKALLLIVAALYVAALLTRPRAAAGPTPGMAPACVTNGRRGGRYYRTRPANRACGRAGRRVR